MGLSIKEISDGAADFNFHHGGYRRHVWGAIGLSKSEIKKEDFRRGHLKGKGNEFKDAKLGPILKVNSQAEYKKHIQKTLRDRSTLAFKAGNDRVLYYNKKTNTLIWQNNKSKNSCSCYRPRDKKHFEFVCQGELRRQKKNSKEWKKHVSKGGYFKLHDNKKDKELKRQHKLTKENNKQKKKGYLKDQEQLIIKKTSEQKKEEVRRKAVKDRAKQRAVELQKQQDKIKQENREKEEEQKRIAADREKRRQRMEERRRQEEREKQRQRDIERERSR